MKWCPEARGQRDSAVAMDVLMNTIRLVWDPAQRADTSYSSAAGTIRLRLPPPQLRRTFQARIYRCNTESNNKQEKKRQRFNPLSCSISFFST